MAPISRSRSRGRSRYRTPPTSAKKRKRGSNSSRYMSWSPVTQAAIERAVTAVTGSSVAGSIASLATTLSLNPSTIKKSYKNNVNVGFSKKITKTKKFKKPKASYKGKLTRYGCQLQGVASKIELRYDTVNGVTPYESVALGHTSMPIKESLLGFCRAMLKMVFKEAGVHIRNFGDLTNSYFLGVGDAITVRIYNGYNATTLTNGASYTIAGGETIDGIANSLCNSLAASTTGYRVRYELVEYIPVAASGHRIISIPLSTRKITVYTDSILKVQNRTVTTAADNEADDVNNVPLTGKLLTFKGNNVADKLNRPLLEGVASGDYVYNDAALVKGFVLSAATVPVNQDWGYVGPSNTNFINMDVPTGAQFQHCVGQSKVRVPPGGIITSRLSKHFTMSVQAYLEILLGSRNAQDNVLGYDSKAGYTRVFYLEKAIGDDVTSVYTRSELELRMVCAIHGKEKSWTTPLEFQRDL